MDPNSGIIYFEAGDEITNNVISFLNEKKINNIDILNINSDKQGTYIRDTFFAYKNNIIFVTNTLKNANITCSFSN